MFPRRHRDTDFSEARLSLANCLFLGLFEVLQNTFFWKMVFSTYKINRDVNNERDEESQTVLRQNFSSS